MENKKHILDKEEQAILDAYHKGELNSISNLEEEKEKAVETAKNTLKKDMRFMLRLNPRDLFRLKAIAIREGLPYQTFISSQLHKLAEGRLVEKKS